VDRKYSSFAMVLTLIFKTPSIKKSHEMKLRLKNYAVIMPIEKGYITFNNELNSLQRYDIALNYKTLHKVV
jgi:hypothetical protein